MMSNNVCNSARQANKVNQILCFRELLCHAGLPQCKCCKMVHCGSDKKSRVCISEQLLSENDQGFDLIWKNELSLIQSQSIAL